MAKIRVVTDSTADIPETVRSELQIETVPLKVHIGTKSYLDGVNITPEEFYPLLKTTDTLPTTSQPSPVDFMEVYKRLAEDPETEIISIHLSSALSGTYQSSVLAKSLLEDKANVVNVDSKIVSYGLGLLAVAAAKAAQKGAEMQTIVDLVHRLRSRTKLYFLVDTLDYLKKGGRIGKAAAMLGTLLNIKPILTVDDSGQVASVDKIRGSKKAMGRIIELLKQEYGEASVNVALVHSTALDTAKELGAMVQNQFQVQEISYTSIGPVIGTHAGPGAVGVIMSPA